MVIPFQAQSRRSQIQFFGMMFHAPAAVLSALKRRKSRKLHKVFAEGKNVNDEDSIDSECIMSGSLLYEDSDIPDFLLEVLFSCICYRSSLLLEGERVSVCKCVYALHNHPLLLVQRKLELHKEILKIFRSDGSIKVTRCIFASHTHTHTHTHTHMRACVCM